MKTTFNNIDGHILAVLQTAYAAHRSNTLSTPQTQYIQSLEAASLRGHAGLEQYVLTDASWMLVTVNMSESQLKYWASVFDRGGLLQRRASLMQLLLGSTATSLWTATEEFLAELGVQDFDGIFVGKNKCK